MQTLHFTKPHEINQLRQELEARGIQIIDLAHRDDDIWITVADDAPVATIEEVVNAHVPAPPPPPPPTPDELVIQELQTATTLDEVKAALIKRFQTLQQQFGQ